MKNKLLVILFATVVAFAFTACKDKSDVLGVNDDLVKVTMHKSARSLVELKGETLSITEYEFASPNVNDNKLVCRTLSFGNGTYTPKNVENLTYEYGEWNESYTAYSLLVTPTTGAPYTMWFGSNAFKLPDGRAIGGEGMDNTARVEKWEKVLKTFPNTNWEATFRDEFVLDSVFRDSIRTRFIPPMTFITDTIQIFDHMDTIGADTTCHYYVNFLRNPSFKNTGTLHSISVRSKYDKATKTTDTLSVVDTEYDFDWYFSEVSSDAKFTVVLKNVVEGEEGDIFSISKYKLDSVGEPSEFLRGGATFKRVVLP